MWLLPICLALGALPAGAFPSLSGEDLTGADVALPGGLRAGRNLLLLAWQREQQVEVDTWLPLARQLDAALADFDYLEIPVIPELPTLVRFAITTGMRSGLPADRHPHVVTLFTDPLALKAALGLPNDERVRALLVSRDGLVGWQADGAFTAGKGASLATALGAGAP